MSEFILSLFQFKRSFIYGFVVFLLEGDQGLSFGEVDGSDFCHLPLHLNIVFGQAISKETLNPFH